MKEIKLKDKVKIFKALGHPSRLFIVETLNNRGELCVCEITDLLGYDISTISKHLNVLKSAGLVKSEKRGNMVMYESLVPCLADFLGCFSTLDESAKPEENT